MDKTGTDRKHKDMGKLLLIGMMTLGLEACQEFSWLGDRVGGLLPELSSPTLARGTGDEKHDESKGTLATNQTSLIDGWPNLSMEQNPTSRSVYYYMLGNMLLRDNHWEEAEAAFVEVAKADPASAEARLTVAHLAVQRGDLAKGAEYAQQVVKLEPDNARAHLLVAGIHAANRQYDEAILHYEAVLRIEPNNAQARLLLAQMYGNTGDVEKTKLILAPMFKNPDLAWRAQLALGRAHLNNRKPELAVELIQKARKMAPRQLEPVLALGAILQEMGQIRESEKIYREYLAGDPDNQVVHSRLGRLLLDQNHVDAALGEFREISRLMPDSVQAKLTTALILISQSKHDDALKELRLAEALQPSNAGIRYYLGQTLEALSRTKEAAIEYAKIAPEDPFYLESQLRQAYLEAERDQLAAAIQRMRHVVELNPKRNDLLLALNLLLLQNKDYAEVVDTATQGLTLEPSQERFWFNRAMALDKMGRWAEAEADLQVYLTKNPDDPQALNYLGYSWADRNEKLDRAYEMLQKASQLQPGDGFIADSLGWALFRLNRLDEALNRMREAVRMEPDDATIQEHLGDVLNAIGKQSEAMTVWKRALELDPQNKTLPDKIKRHATMP